MKQKFGSPGGPLRQIHGYQYFRTGIHNHRDIYVGAHLASQLAIHLSCINQTVLINALGVITRTKKCLRTWLRNDNYKITKILQLLDINSLEKVTVV